MKWLSWLLLLISFPALADNFQIPNITEDELGSIAEEFGANFMHKTVSPPKLLGEVFGLEVGIVGGVTNSPKFDGLVNRVDNTQHAERLGTLAILGRVGTPGGFTFETTFFPKRTFDNVTVNTFSFAVQQTGLGLIEKGPIDIAAKFHLSGSKVEFTQTVGNDTNGSIAFENGTVGMDFLVGLSVPVFQPYLGIGWASTTGKVSYTATTGNSIFTFTTSQSAESKKGTGHFFGGLHLDLWLLHLGVEYAYLFGTGKISFKGSLAF